MTPNRLSSAPPEGGVFKADAKTIESLKKSEQGVVDEGGGVYSWEIEPGKKIFIVQEIAGQAEPARSIFKPLRERVVQTTKDATKLVIDKLNWTAGDNPGLFELLYKHGPVVAALSGVFGTVLGSKFFLFGVPTLFGGMEVTKASEKMPDYKKIFRIDTDRDMSKVLREVKEASHNGGAEHRIKIMIQGKNGVPADPILAKVLTQDLPAQNGTHPVEYEVALSDGSPYYEYRHHDGKATETTREGKVTVLIETVRTKDFEGYPLSDLMALTDETAGEVHIELDAKFPAETAISQMSSMRHSRAVVVFDAGGREVYRQKKNGETQASFVANTFDDIDKITSTQLPSNTKKTVVIGADVARTALKDPAGRRGSMGRLMTGDYDVAVEVRGSGEKETTAVELFVKYPALQEVKIRNGSDSTPFTRNGLSKKISDAEARARAATATFLELPPEIKAAMDASIMGPEWKPGELATQSGREHDIKLVNRAMNPGCTRELQRLASRTTQKGQNLQELLGILSDPANPAPKITWMWLRALALGAVDSGTTERFDAVVDKTLALYKTAGENGKKLTGAVIETVATTDEGCLTLIGYGRTSKGDEIDLDNKLQASRGELATLEYLLTRPEIEKIDVIPRSGTGSGFNTTPDFEIAYKDSSGNDVVELWDVKTSTGIHKPVDAGQFTRATSAEKARRYRVIMLGGGLNDSGEKPVHPKKIDGQRVIKADPGKGLKRDILIEHVPQIRPSVNDMLSIRIVI